MRDAICPAPDFTFDPSAPAGCRFAHEEREHGTDSDSHSAPVSAPAPAGRMLRMPARIGAGDLRRRPVDGTPGDGPDAQLDVAGADGAALRFGGGKEAPGDVARPRPLPGPAAAFWGRP